LAVPGVVSTSPSTAIRGDSLTIAGSGFSPNAADNRVVFTTAGNGSVRVTPTSGTTTSLTVTVPLDATSGTMQVYRTDTPLGGAMFALPVASTATPLLLTSVSPASLVTAGTTLILTGMGFDPTPTNNAVNFKTGGGTVAVTATSGSASSLSVVVPVEAVCGPLTVTTGGQTSNARMLTVSGSACGVQLVGVWGGATPGDVAVLEGAGFDVAAPANNVVKFTSSGPDPVNAAVLAAGGTQLHVRIPETAIDGNVIVTNSAGTSNPPLSYRSPTAIAPASIDVLVNSPVALGSYQLTITFNKNVVTVAAADVKGGNGAGFTAAPTTINIDNAAGTITLQRSQTGNLPTGLFTIANITFTPVAVGTTNLTLGAVSLTDTTTLNILPANAVSLSSNTVSVLR